MPELTKTTVNIDPSAVGSRIMLPNRIKQALKQQGYTEYLLHNNERIFVLKQDVMEIPDVVLDFLKKDRRYAGFILSEVAPVETDPPVDPVETDPPVDDEVEVVAVEDDPIFDYWSRDDIADANLNGDEGLKAYADYHGIDLADNKLADEVRNHILEWFDAVQ